MSIINTLRFIVTHPLTQSSKWSAINRYLKWQVGTRLMSYEVVVEWINGVKFFCSRGETGLTGNIYTGLHEFHDMAFLLHFLRNSDLFVDVGANVGSYTLLAAAAVGAKTVSYEPCPETYTRFVKNVRLNCVEDLVTAKNMAVAERIGVVKFSTNLNEGNHVVVGSEMPGVKTADIDTTTLDNDLRFLYPQMIKIDAEGYEKIILLGASETLLKDSVNAVSIELHGLGERYGVDERLIFKKMKKLGFLPFYYDPYKRELKEWGRDNSKQLINTLFIRNLSFVCERVKKASAFVVHNKKI